MLIFTSCCSMLERKLYSSQATIYKVLVFSTTAVFKVSYLLYTSRQWQLI